MKVSRIRWDDLLEEEDEVVQLALRRLTPKESYDRIFRIRRAVQCSYQHKLLPKEEWTKPEEVRVTSTHLIHPPMTELNGAPICHMRTILLTVTVCGLGHPVSYRGRRDHSCREEGARGLRFYGSCQEILNRRKDGWGCENPD
jgi:hypothetical protein